MVFTIVGTGGASMAGRYKGSGGRGGGRDDGRPAQCQRCLQAGHWTWQCTNEPVYKSRPSRTQQLFTSPKLLDPSEIPDDIRGRSDSNKVAEKSRRRKKRRRSPSSSSSSGTTSTSSSSDSGTSSYSSGSSSYTSSSSSDSDTSDSRSKGSRSSRSSSSSPSSSDSSSSSSSSGSSDSDISGGSQGRKRRNQRRRNSGSKERDSDGDRERLPSEAFQKDVGAQEFFESGKASGKQRKGDRSRSGSRHRD